MNRPYSESVEIHQHPSVGLSRQHSLEYIGKPFWTDSGGQQPLQARWSPIRRQPSPKPGAQLVGDSDGIDAEQAYPAQDERHDGRFELGAAGQPDTRDITPRLGGT